MVGCIIQDLYSLLLAFRSYWVASASWSPGGLFLACVLKRGSLLMLPRLGGLLTLTTTGCSVEFGPAHFLPLHPLVTYRFETFAKCKQTQRHSDVLKCFFMAFFFYLQTSSASDQRRCIPVQLHRVCPRCLQAALFCHLAPTTIILYCI